MARAFSASFRRFSASALASSASFFAFSASSARISALFSAEKYKKFFQTYKPDVKNLRLNYEDGSAEITMHLFIPVSKRIGGKIEINVPPNFQILELYDSAFNRIDLNIERNDKGYKIKTSELPKDSEDFLCKTTGEISSEGLKQFIELRVPSSPFDKDGEDKYWMRKPIAPITAMPKRHTLKRRENSSLPGFFADLSIR